MDTSSSPLADYFWIAGVDSLSYGLGESLSSKANGHVAAPPQVDTTIEECAESEVGSPISSTSNPRADARHSRTNSWSNRLSKLSLTGFDENKDENGSHSNRSSVTIKGVPASGAPELSNGMNGGSGGTLEDFNFDAALIKFAHEREDFLDDLSFNAGVVTQHSRPPMTNRAERLRHDDADSSPGSGRKSPLLKSVGGSIRRRISFRDLNSLKRAPSRNGKSMLYALVLYSA